MSELFGELGIFIYQLPLKTTDIQKNNEFMVIRDSQETKRIKVSLLFDYFSQNSKIDKLKENIEKTLSEYDEKYVKIYEDFDSFLDIYDDVINNTDTGLIVMFSENENRINALAEDLMERGMIIGKIEYNLSDISDKTESSEKSYGEMIDLINRLIFDELADSKDLSNISDKIEEFENDTKEIEEDIIINKNEIENVNKSLNNDLNDKIQNITIKLNNGYDKILALIDHYHHIHDKKYS